MFDSYDLKEFGRELRNIRVNCRLTQDKVYKKVGINPDTLRRVEKGIVMPKNDTLEILSKIYKCDLHSKLQSYKIKLELHMYYTKIDSIIVNHDIDLINSLIMEFDTSVNNKDNKLLNMMGKSELDQFRVFLHCTKSFFSKDYEETEVYADIRLLKNALTLTIDNFHIEGYDKYSYNLFEVRILVLLSLFYEKIEEYNTSTKMLIFSLQYLIDSRDLNISTQKLILKIYSNIAYNFHKLGDHASVLKYTNEGIDFAIANQNMHTLYLLFARKGIAEFQLGNNQYLDSLRKCIHLLEINKQYELSNTYKRITKEKYNITI